MVNIIENAEYFVMENVFELSFHLSIIAKANCVHNLNEEVL